MERESPGSAIIGTVPGDPHSIGKMIVAALLRADGFEVVDFAVDVAVGQFVEAGGVGQTDTIRWLSVLQS